MSTAEILSLVSLISYIVAGICLVIAVFLWFFFKIPTVIGDLSGRTAKKSIEKMRQANVRSGSKSYRSSAVNAQRGKLTDTMQHAAKDTTEKQNTTSSANKCEKPDTDVLQENKATEYGANKAAPRGGIKTDRLDGYTATAPTGDVDGHGETMPLGDVDGSAETMPLGDIDGHEETELLSTARTDNLDGAGQTAVLQAEDTVLLNAQTAPAKQPGGKKLTMINEVMLIHTNEVI